jgi:hypothetical protein
MFGISRRMLLMGEHLRDLLERQHAPQVAALALIGPPARGPANGLIVVSPSEPVPARALARGSVRDGLAPAPAFVSALPGP